MHPSCAGALLSNSRRPVEPASVTHVLQREGNAVRLNGSQSLTARAQSRQSPSLCTTTSIRTGLVRVDLGALQTSRVIDVADLRLGIEFVHFPTAFAVTVAGLFDTAERQVRLRADGRRVDVRDAVVELGDRAERRAHIARVE